MLLDELENVLADDVRILSIAPMFDKNGNIQLTLNFEAKTPQGMLTTIDRMNADPQFRNPFPKSEMMTDGGTYAFNLSVGYIRFNDVPDALGRSGGAMIAGVSFPIPIFDRGQGTVDRGRAIAEEDRVRKDAVELTVRREIERASGAMTVRVSTWRRFRDTTAVDIDRLRTIGELSYREGRATILELLDAYGSFVDAQERRIELQTQAVKSSLDLERAVGPAR